MSSLPQAAATVPPATAAEILARLYGLGGEVEPLPGEHDCNFRVRTIGGRYVLKIHPPAADEAEIDLQDQAMLHLARRDPGLPIPRPVAARSGEQIGRAKMEDGTVRAVRLLTWLPGRPWAQAAPPQPATFASLGRFLARMDRAFAGFEHPALRRRHRWGMPFAAELTPRLGLIADPARRELAGRVLDRFAAAVLPRLAGCRSQAIHNDASDHNVLVDESPEVSGLIDFGDMLHGPLIVNLAVAAAYAMLGTERPLSAIQPLVAAYDDGLRLTDLELELLFDLILTRLAMSIVMAAWQHAEAPGNDYLLISQDGVWDLLRRLAGENRHLAHFALRDACGREPNPTSRRVVGWIESASAGFAPVCPALATAPRTWVDLTAPSLAAAGIDPDDLVALTGHVFGRMREAGARYGVGRYLERRPINGGPQFALPSGERRDLHLGVDLYVEPGEPVVAPLAGTVAGIEDRGPGDYGPVVLLTHTTGEGVPFWTLYGHLDREVLGRLAVGQAVARGERVGRVGSAEENGGWPPHLHLQLLTHTLDEGCALFGVAPEGALDVWESVSPDPNLILGLPEGAAAAAPPRDPSYLQQQRWLHLGRSLSLSYREPLKIVRGEGLFLYDESGRAYLDLVNNVCHVGHCHPRVMAAAREQMGRLNTNTRYLHDALVRYVRRLTATFPEPLRVCFLVNSGSEANDLALRLARAHTGGQDVVVVDHAYHGNLTSLVEISPYKFAGPGGRGRPEHVQVAELPDGYRGRFPADDPERGRRYAESVGERVREIAARGRRLAAFYAESIHSCGGHVVLPPGYLAAAYEGVRAAGGVCIADEVQVGMGRVGSHLWAFETQGVVPDVVTLGKPLGNGHPLAAVVTTPEIAASFHNGMEYFNTFGGNPVSAAIGLAVLDVVRDERLQQNALRLGERLQNGLRELALHHPLIGDVRGLGLFLGAELVRDRATREPAAEEAALVLEAARRRGVLLATEGPHHNVLKLKPPIALGEEHCALFLSVLGEALAEVAEHA
ncbi:MAG TPA: aminotransferase class III-fold pyridoxal phosphate-dependent enzyme [Thermoanaerobaculia bacterium]|nr:aminotransferase class III-fold pyridoxal phosphate-dependent enzyme [Thermoanaerobaculia bacterium]